MIWVVIGVLALLLFAAIGMYNSLVRLRQQTSNAWAQIDVQLKRRYDLIPNLVETVKGYMKHEQDTLEKVIQARNMALQANTIKEKATAEAAVGAALTGIFGLAEAYPDLKANENFMQLQTRITALENGIADRRELYNEAVNINNVRIEQFPDSIVAGMFRFEAKPLLEFAVEEKADVDMKALFG